jgi:DNA helicase HerA-like ATPase
MAQQEGIFIGRGETPQILPLRFANRHGLIAGATGTGKTVTLQILAEGFAAQGVPVFAADVKGDLSGISRAGEAKPFLLERAEAVELPNYAFRGFPTIFWDLFGEQGHPLRTTISDMGPLLLARLLELSEAQEGALNIAFRIADDEGMLVLDLKDLRALLTFITEESEAVSERYGHVAKASVGAIQRRLLLLEQQGGERLFGEPALEGNGIINLLAADRLIQSPRLYASFLLWLLSELFEELPEVGDPDKPKLVFFFDEAHLLFNEAPRALVEKVEQVVRLIRSKGVGVFFVTQNPLDLPDEVLGQLGNRVQHALRAFTPRDQKAVRAAAQTFRQNPAFDCETAITELGVGEALVSTLGNKGVPSIVQRTLIRPPSSRMGPIDPQERRETMSRSPIAGLYEKTVDRESAYELLAERAAAKAKAEAETKATQQAAKTASPGRSRRQTPLEAFTSSLVRQIGRQIGREVMRGILGTLRRGR